MDYEAEQSMELEALQSIYPDSIETQSTTKYTIHLSSTNHADQTPEMEAILVDLHVIYTDTYPEEPPELQISLVSDEDSLGSKQDLISQLETMVKQTVDESLGMAMIFTIASNIQEQLDSCIQECVDEIKRKEEEEKRIAEEKENAKFKGTAVTREAFLEWKRKFDLEIKSMQSKNNPSSGANGGKLTGRQLFEKDSALAASDANYMEEGDVAIDKNLFEREMENLDLEDGIEDLPISDDDD